MSVVQITLLTKYNAHWKIDFFYVTLNIYKIVHYLIAGFKHFKKFGFWALKWFFSIATLNSGPLIGKHLYWSAFSRASAVGRRIHIYIFQRQPTKFVLLLSQNVEPKNKKPIIHLGFYASQQFNCIRAFISASKSKPFTFNCETYYDITVTRSAGQR